MKKKLICVLLSAITILSLVGCGSFNSQKTENKDNTDTKSTSVSNSNSNSKDEEDVEDDEDNDREGKLVEDRKDLFQDEYVKVVYVGVNRTSSMGPEIVLEIENISQKSLTIDTSDVSVDNYMVRPYMSAQVLPGKKVKATMEFNKEEVDKNFKSVEGKITIKNKDDYKDLKDEPFTIKY